MKRLELFKSYEFVVLDNEALVYFARGLSSNGRIHLKCYVKRDNSRYKWGDKHILRSQKVNKYTPKLNDNE